MLKKDGIYGLQEICKEKCRVNTFQYEPKYNEIISYTDPMRRVTNLEYDQSGSPTKIISPNLNENKFEVILTEDIKVIFK